MSATPRITYTTREGSTPEEGIRALANVFAFVLNRHTKNGAARPDDPDGTKGDSTHDSRATRSIRQDPG